MAERLCGMTKEGYAGGGKRPGLFASVFPGPRPFLGAFARRDPLPLP